ITSADNGHANKSLTITTGAGTDTVNLDGSVSTDGNLIFTGVDNVVARATVSLDTEQGNDGSGGAVDFGGASLSAIASGNGVTINTATTQTGSSGGAVTLAAVNSAAGAPVNDLTIVTTGPGGNGAVTLQGNITLGDGTDTGDLSITGPVTLAADVTISTD